MNEIQQGHIRNEKLEECPAQPKKILAKNSPVKHFPTKNNIPTKNYQKRRIILSGKSSGEEYS
jgi:hypothetical protein